MSKWIYNLQVQFTDNDVRRPGSVLNKQEFSQHPVLQKKEKISSREHKGLCKHCYTQNVQ